MVVNSKVLLCAVLTTFVYSFAGAVPLTDRDDNTPKPILHLDGEQIQKFKHTNPDQSEPDVVFPKDPDGLYAAEEQDFLDTEAEETEIESNRASSDQMDDDDDDDDDDTTEYTVSADEEEDEDEENSQTDEESQEEKEEEEEGVEDDDE